MVKLILAIPFVFLTTILIAEAQTTGKPSAGFSIEKNEQNQAMYVPLRDDDPYKGPKHAKVTIVDFSEFQCPACKRALPILKEIEAAYGDNVRIVWKHQPLSFHRNAFPAAEVAEAAREQGKFWEMHDLLFENQRKLSPLVYEELAARLNLNIKEFKASLAEKRNRTRIIDDSSLGRGIGARGTPTFFINGRKVVGAQPLETFRKIVEEELLKADQLLKTGLKLDSHFYQSIVKSNQASN